MRRLSTFLLIAILLGGLFRLTNLSGKVYWHDEVYTALYATGHGDAEASRFMFDGQLKTAGDVMQMQTVVADRGMGDTIRQLAENEAQHPPLYYALTRLMLYVLPETAIASRLVAAIAGILLIPAIYWLTQELFNQSLTATISAALIAVSPFHYLYAQEGREYSLWTLTFVIASAACLRAIKRDRLSSWMVYTLSIVVSLYSCLLTGLVMASHGLYVLWRAITKPTDTLPHQHRQTLRNFLLSSVISLLLFFPWMRLITPAHTAKVSWTAVSKPLPNLVKNWVGNLSRLFFDLNFDSSIPLIYSVLPVLLALILIGTALAWNRRHMPRPAFVFIALLGGVTLITFVGADLLLGGRRSSISRYLIPLYISLQLMVTYFLSQKLSTVNARTLGKSLTAGLLSAGIISCAFSLSADTWWHKKNSHHNPEVVRIINQAPGSLIVSSNNNVNFGELLSLSHHLDADQALLLFAEPNIPTIPQTANTLFLFDVSKQSRDRLAQTYEVTPEFSKGRLWKMKPKKSTSS